MALTFGFYNSINGDRTYDAIQVGQIFDGIITDGIYATYLKAMVVKASDNASEVIVQPGRAWFNHTWTYIDADYPVETPAPEVILDRVDALVLDINAEYSNRENTIIWVTGTPASVNPERPSLTNTTTHHQYPLAYVYRKAGTTMIYAADITNMVGTSSTPFVTGVLTGINIDDLLSQWDDEFHTWENATKVSFEGWMVNQQSVYTTWFNAIKDQMEGDLDEFEAWFETIQGIIDEEAATHLQAEIDELKDMLPAGSHIDISTTEPTLYSRNVTVSDQGGHSKTVQFNASGSATVESFPYIGSIEVTSTDGERIATSNISIPYFGRYNTTLAFWAARVNLKGGAELGGYTVTVKDHLDVTVTSIVLNAEGNGVFTATYPDTYKFVYIYGGQTMETTLQVTQETTYEVEIHGGFNYQAWLTAGRVSKTFTSLDDILADEKTLRQLFLVHDSVDYLANANVNSDVEKIFNTDLAAKWINNSDYALDKFYAVADIKTVMDTADKYGYGEWVLKEKIPTMTSATAPYGEVTTNGAYSTNYAYYAFDGNDSTGWLASPVNSSVSLSDWVAYAFVNAIRASKAIVKFNTTLSATNVHFKIQGSNDGATWVDVSEVQTFSINNETKVVEVALNAATTYSKYRLLADSLHVDLQYDIRVLSLQILAYEPKGNVPVMTANTAPYGEASGSAEYSNYKLYYAFDGNENTKYVTTTANGYIQYKFTNPVCVKKFKLSDEATYYVKNGATIKGSNDGSTWETIYTFANKSGNVTNAYYDCSSNNKYFLYYRLTNNSNKDTQIYTLQFYGRSLSVSVPTMTSNTAPFGTAGASSISSSSVDAYKAFDGNDTTEWAPSETSGGEKIYYHFTNPIIPKKVKITIPSNHVSRVTKGTIIGSNDGNTWTPLGETATIGNSLIVELNNNAQYSYVGLECTTVNDRPYIGSLQFYGLDYSEKEFEVGTTKKWLYDHGVELETMIVDDRGATIVKESDGVYLYDSGAEKWPMIAHNANVANYSLFRAKLGEKYYDNGTQTSSALFATVSSVGGASVAAKYLYSYHSEFPNNLNLDISSDNTSQCVEVAIRANNSVAYAKVTELWLE